MKITAIWVYPIKALRGIPLQSAQLGPQGVRYDRHFMLFKVKGDGSLEKMQLSTFPQCALFEQQLQLEKEIVTVRYHPPPDGVVPELEEHGIVLEVPLRPSIEALEPLEVNLHGSAGSGYRVGKQYDAWFSACFGFATVLAYIGDGRRPVLGTLSPKTVAKPKGWVSSLASLVSASSVKPDWLTFTDCAPLLIANDASRRDVCARLPEGVEVGMYKFRPNIVVDGETQWDEDLWAELTVNEECRLFLTANCGRCTSLNVDYKTGRPAEGELGAVLKKLMRDRRVDPGNKWSPIFGRYAFLPDGADWTVSVGDAVEVARRNMEQTVWDWPGL